MTARRPYDIVTFDCYGTLIDWDGGIAGGFARAVAESGAGSTRTACSPRG